MAYMYDTYIYNIYIYIYIYSYDSTIFIIYKYMIYIKCGDLIMTCDDEVVEVKDPIVNNNR